MHFFYLLTYLKFYFWFLVLNYDVSYVVYVWLFIFKLMNGNYMVFYKFRDMITETAIIFDNIELPNDAVI